MIGQLTTLCGAVVFTHGEESVSVSANDAAVGIEDGDRISFPASDSCLVTAFSSQLFVDGFAYDENGNNSIYQTLINGGESMSFVGWKDLSITASSVVA